MSYIKNLRVQYGLETAAAKPPKSKNPKGKTEPNKAKSEKQTKTNQVNENIEKLKLVQDVDKLLDIYDSLTSYMDDYDEDQDDNMRRAKSQNNIKGMHRVITNLLKEPDAHGYRI
jgi:hypothetical protein